MQLIVADEIVGQRCKGCCQIKRLTDFPRASRKGGRGTWCSTCVKKEISAKNFALSRNFVARRRLVGGTAPLGDD